MTAKRFLLMALPMLAQGKSLALEHPFQKPTTYKWLCHADARQIFDLPGKPVILPAVYDRETPTE